jgi:CheY-like chemotaxis protein
MAVPIIASMHPAPASPADAPDSLTVGYKPRVLVVDDDVSCRNAIGRRLTLLGYDVRLAGSGTEALELFRDEGADLVMTDLRMPAMGGMELIRRLREARPDEPVIAFTGGDLPGLAACLPLERTGVSFLSKPFNEDDLELALRRALGSSDEFWNLWPGGF